MRRRFITARVQPATFQSMIHFYCCEVYQQNIWHYPGLSYSVKCHTRSLHSSRVILQPLWIHMTDLYSSAPAEYFHSRTILNSCLLPSFSLGKTGRSMAITRTFCTGELSGPFNERYSVDSCLLTVYWYQKFRIQSWELRLQGSEFKVYGIGI